ncbi:MAG: dockerin type I repeat-containing protein [Phycisphaerales bacterium]|nr:dockerin type I repeat-containing protein [Phycisphaerales bacterium]
MGDARIVVAWMASVMLASMPVAAGVRVFDQNGQQVPATSWSASQNHESGGWEIVLQELWNPWGNTWFAVEVDSGENVSSLMIDVDGPPAGSPVTVTVGVVGAPVNRIEKIHQSGSAEVVLHDVRVVQHLGEITVQSINFIDAGGDVHGPIRVTTTQSSSRGIRSLDVAGDLLGDVIATDGLIRSIAVLGDIGNEDHPVRIEAGHGLWLLDVRGDCAADIDLCPGTHSGFLHQMFADSFTGTLHANRLDRPAGEASPPMIMLDGWLTGSWTLQQSLQLEDAIIQIPGQGLRGQVILNAECHEEAEWSTPFNLTAVGGSPPLELIGPTYEATPALIGGGSIGLVPYRLHASGCVPPSGTVMTDVEDDLEVVLRFHGPVCSQWGSPLSFERRVMGSQDDFVAVASSDFVAEVDSSDSRLVRISSAGAWGGFEAGWEYRVHPTSSLQCEGIMESVSGDVIYQLGIESNHCVGDIDGSGQVDIVDILLLLALWGDANTPAADAADVNQDGVVAVDDLLIVIGSWGDC